MRTVKLGEVCDIISGATPKTGVESYWGGEIRWATPADLSQLDGKFIADTPRTITEAGLKSCAASVLPPGSVLLSSRAPIGHVAINTEAMATNQGFKSLVPGPDLHADYLYYWLLAHREYLQGLGNGATFKEISKTTTARITIPLPIIAEQRRIAAILDQGDAIRTKRRQVLTHLEALELGLLSEMFGDLARNSKNWPIAPFGAVTTNEDRRRVPLKVSDRSVRQGPYPYYGASGIIDFVDDYIFDGERLLVSEDGANLLARTKPIAFIATGQYWVNNHAHVVAPSSRVDIEYLRAVVNRTDISSSVTGSAQPKLTRAALDRTLIPVPPVELQIEYRSKLDAVRQLGGAAELAVARDGELWDVLQTRAFRGEL